MGIMFTPLTALGLKDIKAKALIISSLSKQAIIQATDDTFFFACAIMLLRAIPIILLKRPKKSGGDRRVIAEHRQP